MLRILQPQVVTFQHLPHGNRLIVNRKDENHLVPRCLDEHGESRSVPFPLCCDSLVGVVVGEYDGCEEDECEVAAGGLEIFVAAADDFVELIGDGAGGGCGEE